MVARGGRLANQWETVLLGGYRIDWMLDETVAVSPISAQHSA